MGGRSHPVSTVRLLFLLNGRIICRLKHCGATYRQHVLRAPGFGCNASRICTATPLQSGSLSRRRKSGYAHRALSRQPHGDSSPSACRPEVLDEAISVFDMSLHNKPNYIKGLWARCISQLPMIFRTQSDIQMSRDRYYNELVKLRRIITFITQKNIEDAAGAVGSLQPFYLAPNLLLNLVSSQAY